MLRIVAPKAQAGSCGAVGRRLDQPVALEPGQYALAAITGDRLAGRLVSLQQRRHDTAACPAIGVLEPPGRRAPPGDLAPGAAVTDWAGAAAWRARTADRGPELHHRLIEVGRLPGRQRRASARRERRRAASAAVVALEHPPHVGVDRRLLPVPRERPDRGRRVRADARERR